MRPKYADHLWRRSPEFFLEKVSYFFQKLFFFEKLMPMFWAPDFDVSTSAPSGTSFKPWKISQARSDPSKLALGYHLLTVFICNRFISIPFEIFLWTNAESIRSFNKVYTSVLNDLTEKGERYVRRASNKVRRNYVYRASLDGSK